MADLILHRKPQREFPREDAASGKSFSYFKPSEIASVAILILFMCGWHWRVTGTLNAAACATLVMFVFLCLGYGGFFTRFLLPLFESPAGLAFQFLAGYFIFNSLLFILALCSPIGMGLNVAALGVVALIGLIISKKYSNKSHILHALSPTLANQWATFAAIVIACVGATIWCGDAQAPLPIVNGSVVFQVWPDTYIHAREISVFANSHGINTIQDIKFAGGRAPIYHFASYLSPAAVSLLSGASAMQVYASLQLPLGIMLTGLAAYCLMSKLFGYGPGVAAVVAVIFVPDAFQQGFQNRYLSYYFLSQVNLGMLYGISCVAMAWMFILDGCNRGKYKTVLLGYAFLVICLFYKAHIFVANSYILMMFPFIFYPSIRISWRIILGILATMIFCLAIAWSQTNPRVPVLRLDGSGIGKYLVQLLQDYEAGWIRREFRRIFIDEKHSLPVQALYAAAMLLLSTFGIWFVGSALVLATGWRRLPRALRWFPIIVVGNYLIMALGLALDTRNVGTPDELVNRPLVWAYFVLATWTAAAGYWLFVGSGHPKVRAFTGAVIAIFIFGITAVFNAPNLQTFPGRFERATFVESGSVPQCVIKIADYLRNNSSPNDVLHDSNLDPGFILTALSERQLYVGETTFGGKSDVHESRLHDVAQLSHISTSSELEKFADLRGIDWVLQNPGSALSWPQAILERPAVSCGGYRLFHVARHALSLPTAAPVTIP